MKKIIRSTALAACAIASLFTACAGQAQETADLDDINVYRLGAYYGEGSSYALQLDLDFAITGSTRLSFGGAYIQAKGDVQDIDSYQGNVEVEHSFGAWGFALEGNYRDDDSVITTIGMRGRGYYRTDRLSAGVRLGRNRIDVSYDLPAILRQYIDDTQRDYNTEYGVDLRYSFGKVSLYTSGADYEYDEPLSSLAPRRYGDSLPVDRFPLLQERLAAARARLAAFNFATLRFATNLLDYSVIIGADYTIGEHVLNLELARERVEIDAVEIDSVDVGWIIPIAAAADLEIRVGNAMVQHADSLFYGSLNFTFYR